MNVRNLALGKRVNIQELAPIEYSFAEYENQQVNKLTNGSLGDLNSDDQWTKFCGGFGRIITIDLGELYSISEFDIGFLHNTNADIYCPENVYFAFSENGIDFYEVCALESPFSLSFSAKARAVYLYKPEKPFSARFVKIKFYIESQALCDQIRVLGSECLGIEEKLSGDKICYEAVDSFRNGSPFDNIKNIAALPFGYSSKGESIGITKSNFISCLGRFDEQARLSGALFDSVLLKLNRFAPSGGAFSYMEEASKLSDWESLIDEMFAPERNLKALDEAVSDLKNCGLYDKDFKLKVFLTAPVPRISLNVFGNLNGDGIQKKLLDVQDCVDAFCWFVDSVERRFEAECLYNIQIYGWNWNDSSLGRKYFEDNPALVEKCLKKLDEKGYKSIMISFFQASGMEKAKSIGFDAVAMHPIYSIFGSEISDRKKMLEHDFAETIEAYGFSPAIYLTDEICHNNEAKESFNNGLLIYSQGMRNRVNVFDFQSSDIIERIFHKDIYKNICRYLKGDLEKSNSAVETESIAEFLSDTQESDIEPEACIQEQTQQKETPPVSKSKKSVSKAKKQRNTKINKYALGAAAAAAVGLLYIIKKLKDD